MAAGEVRGHYVTDTGCFAVPNIQNGRASRLSLPGWRPVTQFRHNLIAYDWGAILGELLRGAPDAKNYSFGGMYLEFENNGGAAVTPPSPSRGGNHDYYASLASSATRDYLRVPVVARTLDSTDELLYPRGNRISVFAQSSGSVGVHGKPFSVAASSRVYGGSLVAFPDIEDASQDLIFSRFYYENADDQLIKLLGAEIGIEWRIKLR